MAYAIYIYRKEFHLTSQQFKEEVDWQDFVRDMEFMRLEAKTKAMDSPKK
jgi:L-arabinose isomerase